MLAHEELITVLCVTMDACFAPEVERKDEQHRCFLGGQFVLE
jgi:hypothetical protein